jgi:predicted nucleic acid-binding protein
MFGADSRDSVPLPDRRNIVLDSTALVNLAAGGLLDSLGRLPERLLVTPEVEQEVVAEGESAGRTDATALRALLDRGTLVRVAGAGEGKRRLDRKWRLSRADASVLAVALREHRIVGSDDRRLRKAATVEGAEVGGTGYVLARLVATGALTRDEARAALDLMIAAGWWCTVETYSRILRALDV